MALFLKGIYKRYGSLVLFEDFHLRLEEGAITCLTGPSGCGKTTLLNIMGGLVPPDAGSLEGFARKRFSYVFQSPRLLPWKTVAQNLDFVLPRTQKKAAREALVQDLLRRVKLEAFAHYYPAELSGGMCQRVSIARAFALPSDLILMDEPLTGLDAEMQAQLMDWFAEVWAQDPRTVVMVTHHPEQAQRLGAQCYSFTGPPLREVEGLIPYR